jgi:integrase
MPFKFADGTEFSFCDKDISRLPPPPSGKKEYWVFDIGGKSSVPGLGVRVGLKQKRFQYQGRAPDSGKQKRVPIGTHPAVTVAVARQVARKHAGDLAHGIDISEKRRESRDAHTRTRAAAALTLGKLISEWEAEKAPRSRGKYVPNAVNAMRRGHKAILNRPVMSIRVDEWESDWESIANRPVKVGKRDPDAPPCGSSMADAIARRVCAVLNWGVQKRKLERNPAAQANLPPRGESRDRELSGDEARAIWTAAGTLPPPYGTFIRVLIGTGLRYSEASRARWPEFNDDLSKWQIPRGA